jgi:hypothetical protein
MNLVPNGNSNKNMANPKTPKHSFMKIFMNSLQNKPIAGYN